MGTPASVASDPPGRAAPSARGRKRASANIFQGVGLPELRSLFQSGGAERPEERARLVWRYAGQRRMARALRQLRRRRAARPLGQPGACTSLQVLAIHQFLHDSHQQEELLQPFPVPGSPLSHKKGPQTHKQSWSCAGWPSAGCTAARNLTEHRGKSQARAAAVTCRMDGP
uniref:Arginine vasopressin-induced protein 1 n=1 Tax=Gallus gallus TaxID=9031 RepID=A0A8V0Z822_CHICK